MEDIHRLVCEPDEGRNPRGAEVLVMVRLVKAHILPTEIIEIIPHNRSTEPADCLILWGVKSVLYVQWILELIIL